MYESNDRMVSHPSHYQSSSGLEVIQVIKAFTEDLKGIEATHTGNIIKYACRWKKKNGIQDLKKIMWYAQDLIDYLERREALEAADEPCGPDALIRCNHCHCVVNFENAAIHLATHNIFPKPGEDMWYFIKSNYELAKETK